jgi:hypothetical protein
MMKLLERVPAVLHKAQLIRYESTSREASRDREMRHGSRFANDVWPIFVRVSKALEGGSGGDCAHGWTCTRTRVQHSHTGIVSEYGL